MKEQKRKGRSKKQGTVVSDSMDKTVVVEVDRMIKHERYGKHLEKSSKFKAHDEENQYSEGDEVEIMETRPLSKDKRWRVVGKID